METLARAGLESKSMFPPKVVNAGIENVVSAGQLVPLMSPPTVAREGNERTMKGAPLNSQSVPMLLRLPAEMLDSEAEIRSIIPPMEVKLVTLIEFMKFAPEKENAPPTVSSELAVKEVIAEVLKLKSVPTAARLLIFAAVKSVF
jgi:hypothetical protein